MATTTKKITQLVPKNVLPVLNTQDIPIWAIDTDTEEVIKVSDTTPARELASMTKNARYLFFYVFNQVTDD